MFDVMTYVVACKALPDRTTHMINQLSRHDFTNVRFYFQYDAADLTPGDIFLHYVDDPVQEREKYQLWFPQNQPRSLKATDVSVSIKYCKIFEMIANGDDDYALILEDDSILCEGFADKFNDLFTETPASADMIFLASCCNLHGNQRIYRKDHPATRCLGATVIKRSTCIDLMKTIIPFHLCIDWEMNYQLYAHDHEVYWWEPPLVAQGSETGLFRSSMR